MEISDLVLAQLLFLPMLYASVTDITRFKVYNHLNFPLFFAGIFFHGFLWGMHGVSSAMTGSLIGFAILFVPYLLGGLGAGDVKFVMAIGAWIGVQEVLDGVVFGCIALLIYYVLIISVRVETDGIVSKLRQMLFGLVHYCRNFSLPERTETVQQLARSGDSRKRRQLIPFSAMMSIGMCVSLLT